MPFHSRSVLLVLLLACATAAADPPPVMFRGNPEHTGVSGASFFPGQGGVKWRVQTGGAVRSSPAVTATRLFVGSGDGHLYALERTRERYSGNLRPATLSMPHPQLQAGLSSRQR